MKLWNKLGEKDLLELYSNYGSQTLEEFREFCLSLMSRAKSPNLDINKTIATCDNKDTVLKITNNFIMSGNGFKVIK